MDHVTAAAPSLAARPAASPAWPPKAAHSIPSRMIFQYPTLAKSLRRRPSFQHAATKAAVAVVPTTTPVTLNNAWSSPPRARLRAWPSPKIQPRSAPAAAVGRTAFQDMRPGGGCALDSGCLAFVVSCALAVAMRSFIASMPPREAISCRTMSIAASVYCPVALCDRLRSSSSDSRRIVSFTSSMFNVCPLRQPQCSGSAATAHGVARPPPCVQCDTRQRLAFDSDHCIASASCRSTMYAKASPRGLAPATPLIVARNFTGVPGFNVLQTSTDVAFG